MKINQLGQAVDATTSLETVKMSIDASAVDVLMNNLTNLYSDPALAVLREYTSNAIDSHMRAGVDAPIEVTTPNGTSNLLVIQDHGTGLSKDELANVYSRYGLSTKGSSNDEIGGFGLGCKSALAIADRFDIVSVKDGIETFAYIQKNVKGVGVVHFVSEEATDKPNGVKVIIPIESRHLNRFSKNNIFPFFVGYKSNTIKLNGEIVPTMFDAGWTQITTGGEIIGAIYESRVEYGSIQSSYHTIAANVGGVTYNLQSFTMHNEELSKFYSKARSYKVVLNLPIGSVDLTPSREALMNTERTNASLSATIKDAEQAITDAIVSRILEKENVTDAAIAYVTEKRRWSFDTPVTYRGVSIEDYISFKDAGQTVTKLYRDKRTKNKSAQINVVDSVYLGAILNQGNSERIYFVKGIYSDELAKNLVYYTQKVYGTDVFTAVLFNDNIKNVSPLFDALTDSFVSAEEVISIATEYRSVNRKAALAASKELRGSGVVKTAGSLPVLDLADEYDGKVKPYPVELLQGAGKVAYIHANESNSRLGRIFPTLGWHYNNGDGVKVYDHNGIMSTVRQVMPGYKIVFLAGNRKVDKFLEMVPQAVEVGAEVQKFALAEINDKANLIAHKLIANGHRHHSSEYRQVSELVTSLKNEKVFNLISNEADKVFLDSLALGYDRNDVDVQLFDNWGRGNQKVENDVTNITSTLEAFNKKYALLSQLRIYTNEQAVHLVSYMNSVA